MIDTIEERHLKAAGRAFRGAMGAVIDQMSIQKYIAVFGAVPNKAPYRQWLYDSKSKGYVHIADAWRDHELRRRVLERLHPIRNGRLRCQVQRDFEDLDDFAAAPAAMAQLRSILDEAEAAMKNGGDASAILLRRLSTDPDLPRKAFAR